MYHSRRTDMCAIDRLVKENHELEQKIKKLEARIEQMAKFINEKALEEARDNAAPQPEPASGDRLKALVEQFHSPGVKWRTYPNPMRSDGVFVAEDKPCEPYPGVRRMDGSPIYRAIPQTEHSIPFQLPHAEAEELVRMLNIGICVKTEEG